MKELQLTESQKHVLADHRAEALEQEKVIRWLEELLSSKKDKIASLEAEIQSIQLKVKDLKTSCELIDIHKTTVVNRINKKLSNLLSKIVEELKIEPATKVQLSFDAGVPKLLIHD